MPRQLHAEVTRKRAGNTTTTLTRKLVRRSKQQTLYDTIKISRSTRPKLESENPLSHNKRRQKSNRDDGQQAEDGPERRLAFVVSTGRLLDHTAEPMFVVDFRLGAG